MPETPTHDPAAPAGEAVRRDLDNGYVLMMAETPNKWRIVDPDGHDQGYIVSEPDRLAAFVEAMEMTAQFVADVAADSERTRLHKLVLEMLQHREHQKDIGVRCDIALAASTVKRGRHLTEREKLLNLARGLADGDEQGRSADDWMGFLTKQEPVLARQEPSDAAR